MSEEKDASYGTRVLGLSNMILVFVFGVMILICLLKGLETGSL